MTVQETGPLTTACDALVADHHSSEQAGAGAPVQIHDQVPLEKRAPFPRRRPADTRLVPSGVLRGRTAGARNAGARAASVTTSRNRPCGTRAGGRLRDGLRLRVPVVRCRR